MPFNTVSVLAGGLLTGEMTDRGYLEKLCSDLMKEVILIARACGVELPNEMVSENIEYTRSFPPYKTSMLVDCENNRPLEVDAIAGNVLALAEKHNVPAPHLETVFALLKAFNDHRQRVM